MLVVSEQYKSVFKICFQRDHAAATLLSCVRVPDFRVVDGVVRNSGIY
jgi:hypothetical protein